ncbi:MAG: F0F1 ATP synthase subunit epsilon, partial [bacterium]|nr:F0F1 ATP synthase subunit epsilon [bacterium]
MRLKILTPEKTIVDKTVESVTAPGAKGEFEVLPGHIDFLTLLEEGEVSYEEDTRSYSLKIGGGFAEVHKDQV